MNLLEFKRFAELKKQYDWLIIECKDEETVSIEPVVRMVTPKDLFAKFVSKTDGSSFIDLPPAKLLGADFEELIQISPEVTPLTVKPIVVLAGTKTQLESFIKVLTVLGIRAYVDNHIEMSSGIRVLNVLAILVGMVIGTGVSAEVAPLSIEGVSARGTTKTEIESLIRPASTHPFFVQGEGVSNILVKFSEIPLLKYGVRDEIYSKIAAKLSVDADLLRFKTELESLTSEDIHLSYADLKKILVEESIDTKISAVMKVVT